MSILKNLKLNHSIYIFIFISLVYFISNIIYLELNTPIIPKCIDGIHFYDIFKQELLYFNAPLITWIMKILFSIFNKQYFDLQIIIVNYIFFIISLYFIYKIGVKLKDKEVGNIAMILFSLTPIIYCLSRHYGHQDWHVMVAIIVNIYFLIQLNNFKDKKWSILYGISVGLGMLIKDEFLAYFFTPWLYVVIRSLVNKIEREKIVNIIITILTGSLISGCHYFRPIIINKILHEPIIETAPIFAFDSLRVMTIGLWDELLSLPIFILFIISILWFILYYKSKIKLIILLWFIIPWLIITFMPHFKISEYGTAFIPAIILIISLFIANIKKYILKKIVLVIICFICILQFVDFSYGFLNLKLFNSYINLQNHRLYYYNNDLIYRKKYNFDLTIELVNRLKKYSNYSFCIYYYDDTFLQKDGIISFANINDINIFKNWDINIYDIDKTDMILKIGIQRSLEDISNDELNMLTLNMKKQDDVQYNNLNNKLNIDKTIHEQFYLFDSFYLKNLKKPEYFIQIYKKKIS